MSQAQVMDFFAHQERARRHTGWLVVLFLGAVIGTIAAVNAATVLAISLAAKGQPVAWLPVCAFATVVTAAIILVAMAVKSSMLRSGGGAGVAESLGGRLVAANASDPDERRLLNVVEEMAIASGTPVPPVYLLDEEEGINAFAAGFTVEDAVIGVTRGCVQRLSRDELQGVVAHEFSHILNGDMRLNLRLMGLLFGILVLAVIGRTVLSLFGNRRGVRVRVGGNNKGKGGGGAILLAIILLGVLLFLIGSLGVFFGRLIQAAVSRQREYLADAAAVQFTRNPQGIAGALTKILRASQEGRVEAPNAAEASHLFFANALKASWFGALATHPPLPERIRRIDPAFDGNARRETAGEVRERVAAGHEGRWLEPPPLPAAFALAPEAVVERVGAPATAHLEQAHALHEAVPAPLLAAARETFGARAVVLGLLLGKQALLRLQQLDLVERTVEPALYRELAALLPALAALPDALRLPLLDLAMPALRRLSATQYAAFRTAVDAVARADQEIDLFEYMLQRHLVHTLDPLYGRLPPKVGSRLPLSGLAAECNSLLSALVSAGGTDEATANLAFDGGVIRLNLPDQLFAWRRDEHVPLAAVDAALQRLRGIQNMHKRRLLAACAAVVTRDGKVTQAEAELLRAVAVTLDCPLPPLLPTAAS
jgi:Zn-dependent protease with chaperone function